MYGDGWEVLVECVVRKCAIQMYFSLSIFRIFCVVCLIISIEVHIELRIILWFGSDPRGAEVPMVAVEVCNRYISYFVVCQSGEYFDFVVDRLGY